MMYRVAALGELSFSQDLVSPPLAGGDKGEGETINA